MTVDFDYREWLLWGQSGTALIDGQWIEGIAIYRHRTGQFVHFISAEYLDLPLTKNITKERVTELAVTDFRSDPDTRPFCKERPASRKVGKKTIS